MFAVGDRVRFIPTKNEYTTFNAANWWNLRCNRAGIQPDDVVIVEAVDLKHGHIKILEFSSTRMSNFFDISYRYFELAEDDLPLEYWM